MQKMGLSELPPGRVDRDPVLVRPLHLAGALALHPDALAGGAALPEGVLYPHALGVIPRLPALFLRPRAANVIKGGAMSRDVISIMPDRWQLECFCISIQLDIPGYFPDHVRRLAAGTLSVDTPA